MSAPHFDIPNTLRKRYRALSANDVRVHRYPVAWVDIPDGGTARLHHSGELIAGYHRVSRGLEDTVAETDLVGAQPCRGDSYQRFVAGGLRLRPVGQGVAARSGCVDGLDGEVLPGRLSELQALGGRYCTSMRLKDMDAHRTQHPVHSAGWVSDSRDRCACIRRRSESVRYGPI